MAIKIVNPRYEGFIFDGENSRDYGIYVQDVKVFGAPVRDVEMVSIPGRDGEFVLDKGRFNNIQVVYTCAFGTGTQTDFNTGISDFRNWLASRKGYKRLEDEINIGEYRMAVFKDGLDVSTLNKETGTFEVAFDCKPQRFLKSGEIPRAIGGSVTNTQTKSGTVVSIDSDGGDKATSLIATIEAIQAGSGAPSPTNVRAITGWTAANVNVAGKNLISFKSLLDKWGSGYTDMGDGSYNVTSIGVGYREPFRFASKDIDVTLSGEVTQLSGSTGWQLQLLNSSDVVVATLGYGSTLSGNGCKLRLNYHAGGTGANYKNIQVELGTAVTAYEPYTGTTTTTALGTTVYGGTVDVVAGTLTLTHKAETFDGSESWGKETTSAGLTNFYLNLGVAGKMTGRKSGLLSDALMCNWLAPSATITTYSAYVNTSGKFLNCKCESVTEVADFKSILSATPLVIVYPLETPQTYTLTAQEVSLLTGNNNVWADTGDISITYGHDPNVLVNPTLFETRPLLQADGYGQISINGDSLSIYNLPLGEITLPYAVRINDPALGLTYTYDISNTNFLNVGDEILFTSRKLYGGINAYFSGVTEIISGTNFTENITSAGGTVSKKTYWATNESTLYKDPTEFSAGYDFTLKNVRFSYGTASTQTFTVSFTINGKTSSNATKSANISESYQVTYDGDNTIAVNFLAPVVSESVTVNKYGFPLYGKSEVIKANSTYSLNTTTYIDLDIGEAYAIEDGQATSLNNVVEIPAELPTLKSGVNTITYDNTITQLEIVPRWWKA